ncbi:hypothetical protein Q4512_00015 [Oceanihabitans sp. 2_MG-2023]|uniref:hypothetical protein n=1 Tax=Oceanihabitans sp. 2_MG-2023 TaxID=3062661 RepID=UPI0026E2BBC8|nr:hypothetical protein [Oceanihabitans sp. 2_MG-2023]MDO6595274.1 hypothetical protein [Oceanihabitans sp. 2_MG-2023]
MKITLKIISLLVFILLISSCSSDNNESESESLEGQGQSQLIFSAFGDIGCGVITVAVDLLETKTMDGQDPSTGFVYCQDSSASVVQWIDIPAGSYNYVASCSGYTWTGTRVLGIGSCNNLSLTVGSAD